MSNEKIYQMVTNAIIERLEEGTVPWHRSWKGGVAEQNYASKHVYRGINQVLLSMKGYASPYWLTMKQANKLGGKVRGSYTPVIFWKWIKVRDKDATSLDDEKKIPLLRFYKAWNIEQCEGIDFKNVDLAAIDFEPHERCEELIADMEDMPEVKFIEQSAYYSPVKDYINMPNKDSFETVEAYYATFFHELVHSTGHPGRVGRFEPGTSGSFGSESYSKEELIAEMGASFLGALAGIAPPVLDNQAAYIASWLRKLREDSGLLVTAGANAQKAVDYILNDVKEPYTEEKKKEMQTAS